LTSLVVDGPQCPESWAVANVRKTETNKSDKMLDFIRKITKESKQMCRRTTELSFGLYVLKMRNRRLKRKNSQLDIGKA
jgi:hypothetical protein